MIKKEIEEQFLRGLKEQVNIIAQETLADAETSFDGVIDKNKLFEYIFDEILLVLSDEEQEIVYDVVERFSDDDNKENCG